MKRLVLAAVAIGLTMAVLVSPAHASGVKPMSVTECDPGASWVTFTRTTSKPVLTHLLGVHVAEGTSLARDATAKHVSTFTAGTEYHNSATVSGDILIAKLDLEGGWNLKADLSKTLETDLTETWIFDGAGAYILFAGVMKVTGSWIHYQCSADAKLVQLSSGDTSSWEIEHTGTVNCSIPDPYPIAEAARQTCGLPTTPQGLLYPPTYTGGCGASICVGYTTAQAPPPPPRYPAGPTVFNPNNTNTEVYFNSNGVLTENYKSGGSWSGPASTGAAITDRPAAIYDPNNGNMEIFLNSGGVLKEKYWSPSSGWSGLGSLGVSITGRPSVVHNPNNGNIEIYFNSGGVLKEIYWSPSSGWSGLGSLGVSITGSPNAIYDPSFRNVEVYFNSGGVVKEMYWSPSTGWAGPGTVGGTITGSPAVVYNPNNGNVEVYFNSGNVVTENFHTASGWSGPQTLGGAISGEPAVVFNHGTGNIEIYFNSSGVLKEHYWSPASGWALNGVLSGTISNSPWAFYNPNRTDVDVYYQSGTALVANFHSNTGWSAQQSIGGTITA